MFPRLEAAGVTGPPRIMRMEHEDLRAHKHELQELISGVGEMDFSRFKEELRRIANFLVYHLRDHIYKENYILYPTAVQMIDDDEVWDELHREADAIGYCCFTPKE